MTIANVLQILLLILGLMLVFQAYWLFGTALFPRLVAQARDRYKTPIRTTLIGLAVVVPTFLVGFVAMGKGSNPVIQIIGIVIGIGILPILYGLTMAAIQALSPPPTDPTQKMIMRFLPLIFMFVFGGFAAGLVMYWVWSNTLSLIQQYFIMRRNGVETELDKLIGRLLGRKKEDA